MVHGGRNDSRTVTTYSPLWCINIERVFWIVMRRASYHHGIRVRTNLRQPVEHHWIVFWGRLHILPLDRDVFAVIGAGSAKNPPTHATMMTPVEHGKLYPAIETSPSILIRYPTGGVHLISTIKKKSFMSCSRLKTTHATINGRQLTLETADTPTAKRRESKTFIWKISWNYERSSS